MAYRTGCRTTIVEAYTPGWCMLKEYEYSTNKDGDVVRVTGCKRCSEMSRLADQAMHKGSGEYKHT